MNRIILKTLLVILGIQLAMSLQAQEKIVLWPMGKMPNSKGLQAKDSIVKEYLFTTTEPRMYVYPAAKENNTGAAILIVPGGGYLRLPADYSKMQPHYITSQKASTYLCSAIVYRAQRI
ncbi:hypothetical protein LWM68_10210 [Niabella sp. W65]|nr:hypothetical protein [Niabella sp. W65]MCH7363109.1 hypothetical protein [Niabella sp. W65]ULT39039.1 hypothetical protein KRR40_28915 [Niabella sp. I65]